MKSDKVSVAGVEVFVASRKGLCTCAIWPSATIHFSEVTSDPSQYQQFGKSRTLDSLFFILYIYNYLHVKLAAALMHTSMRVLPMFVVLASSMGRRDVDQLMSWATHEGIEMKIHLRATGNETIESVASEPVLPGEVRVLLRSVLRYGHLSLSSIPQVFLSIPKRLALCTQHANATFGTEWHAKLRQPWHVYGIAGIELALTLLVERHRRERSTWHSYIGALPSQPIPIHQSAMHTDDVRGILKDTIVGEVRVRNR